MGDTEERETGETRKKTKWGNGKKRKRSRSDGVCPRSAGVALPQGSVSRNRFYSPVSLEVLGIGADGKNCGSDRWMRATTSPAWRRNSS